MDFKLIRKSLNDLKCLNPGEFSYRALDTVLRVSGLHRRIFKPGWMSDEAVLQAFGNHFVSRADLCQYLRSRKNVTFFFPPESRDEYKKDLNKIFPGQREVLLKSARKVLEHRFDLLGKQYNFGNAVDWHCAEDGNRWPLNHWGTLHITGRNGLGDLRPLWELNRHQQFYILGRAYWWTGDERYAEEFVSQLKSWFRDNPPELGINWQSNLEIAVRSVSWLWAYHFFLQSATLDDETLFDLVRAFLHSASHLDRHISFSRYCMRNNHYIGDAAGLALIAQTFPELKQAKSWKRKAFKILYDELRRQVYADGVNWEQALCYHRFVLYFYLLVFRMEHLNGGEIPLYIWSYLEKMFEVVMWVSKPEGSVPMVGDSDDGVAVLLGNESLKDLRPVLATGAIMFGRGDFKFVARQISEETFWLFGINVLEQWNELQGKAPGQNLRSFNTGGLYVARSGWDTNGYYLLFKNGPHSTFHAHADQLHVELAAYGQDLLIDPGTYIYNASPHWRNFFRGTHAHNTLVVDGQSQSVPHRAFRWLEVAKPFNAQVCAGERVQWMWGGHSGYERLADPVTHQRGILNVTGEYAVVFDELNAGNNHHYEFNFHFPPGKTEFCHDQCKYTSKNNSVGLVIYPIDFDKKVCDVVEGQMEPCIQGWVSYHYGVREPAPVFRCSTEVSGAWHTGFVLWPFSADVKKPVISEQKRSSQEEPVMFTIKHGNVVDLICYAGNAEINYEVGQDVTTDSKAIFYRSSINGQSSHLFAVKGTKILIDRVINLAGSWRYVELNIQDRTAFLKCDIFSDIELTSKYIDDLEAGEDLLVNQVSSENWIISKKSA
ncbi:MAG: Heparin-sulfate lyase precursor [Pelotomaculum sp. PtaB.Bin104]|nr:MAG: Heparin-sulfate lyase precursor [Pelotomaculum sp. PtaB.Bin104]